jgi:hypothetical protein
MTLENVCFKHDLREASEKAIEVGNKKYGANHKGEFECFYWVDKGKFFGHYDNFKRRKLIAPSDYLLLLSAPESQAHLLTEKDAQDCTICGNPFKGFNGTSRICCHEARQKLISQPPVMEGSEIVFNSEILGKQLYKNVVARAEMLFARGENKTEPADRLDVERYTDGYAACYKAMNQKTANLQLEVEVQKKIVEAKNQIIVRRSGFCNEQAKTISDLQSEVEQLKGLLQELVDIQNGAPLEQHKKEWQEIIEKCYSILSK